MFKKLLIASTVLVASSTVAFAGHASYKGDYKGEQLAPVAPCATASFGVGPYLGLSIGPRVNVTTIPSSFVGFDGTASLGYGMMAYPNFYLAGEIFGGGSANIKAYKNANGTSPRSTWNYGASVLPGVMINNDVLGYLRAGVVRSRFTSVRPNGSTVSSNKNLTGFQVGGGAQTNVAPNLDVRGEYVYSQYQNTSVLNKVQGHQFNLGLVYKFM
jgi:opacity protein-like surface antigen